jgi:hypothetical protein
MLHHISNQLYLLDTEAFNHGHGCHVLQLLYQSSVLCTNMHHLFAQETSLLLGNLVDVLDEIKFAKMKLLNLASAAFVLESQTCLFSLSYLQCLQFTDVNVTKQ